MGRTSFPGHVSRGNHYNNSFRRDTHPKQYGPKEKPSTWQPKPKPSQDVDPLCRQIAKRQAQEIEKQADALFGILFIFQDKRFDIIQFSGENKLDPLLQKMGRVALQIVTAGSDL